jgi:hypothetical protein
MQATMQAPPGAAALLAVLEQEMQSMLRQKLELQTELQLVATLANMGCSSSAACDMQLFPGTSAVAGVQQVPGSLPDVLLQRLQQLVDKNQQLEATVAQLKHDHKKEIEQQQAAAQLAVAVPDMSTQAAADSDTSSVPMLQLIQQQQQMLTQLLQACEQQQQQQQQLDLGSWHVLQTATEQVKPAQLCGLRRSSWHAACCT